MATIDLSQEESPFLDGLLDGPSAADMPFRTISDLVGQVYEISYHTAIVAVNDHDREQAGGLPMGGFLIAAKQEGDESFILLRILREARLPNAADNSQTRQHAIEATANEEAWSQQLDDWTRDRLAIHGIECRVLGTFRADHRDNYRFAEDIDNYFAVNQLLAWKPGDATLSMIVNHRHHASLTHRLARPQVVGTTRFAASQQDSVTTTDVLLYPDDMLGRRTVYLGKSRSGKSNAMKIAAEAIYRMREDDPEHRIGQLIFDPNGEYAQDNPQDGAGLHRVHQVIGRQRAGEVATYGLFAPPTDPERTITKINFYGQPIPTTWSQQAVESALEQLLVGRAIIQSELASADSKYIKAFRDADLAIPKLEPEDRGEIVRYRRTILAYQTALAAAGLDEPDWQPTASGLFSDDLLTSMERDARFATSARRMKRSDQQWSWAMLRQFFVDLNSYISERNGPYREFNQTYLEEKSRSGQSWAEPRFADILQIFYSQNGPRSFQRVREQHEPSSSADYAESIVDSLLHGQLVIVDQSTGDPDQNKVAAERIMWKVFNRQQDAFRSAAGQGGLGGDQQTLIVYLEEAHNLLPRAQASDSLKTVWARSAKEGSKLGIGLVLATQAPSSIMPEILSETDNWILAHLNSASERRVVGEYEEFADFLDQIGQVSEPGFVRMRSLSLAYTVPMRFRRFRLDLD